MDRKKRALVLVFSFLVATFLGLARVWVNVERVDLAYELEKLQGELEKNRDLRSKLIVERDNLLSSCNLRNTAQEEGLNEPSPDQIRKLRGE